MAITDDVLHRVDDLPAVLRLDDTVNHRGEAAVHRELQLAHFVAGIIPAKTDEEPSAETPALPDSSDTLSPGMEASI